MIGIAHGRVRRAWMVTLALLGAAAAPAQVNPNIPRGSPLGALPIRSSNETNPIETTDPLVQARARARASAQRQDMEQAFAGIDTRTAATPEPDGGRVPSGTDDLNAPLTPRTTAAASAPFAGGIQTPWQAGIRTPWSH